MGLHPLLAKYSPASLRRFCNGLRYPNAFVISLPTFILGLIFSPYIPHYEEVLTIFGVGLFFLSKARWE